MAWGGPPVVAQGASPLFTFGVTAYKQRELLGFALASIRAQSFRDFEVVVGNDNPDDPLDARRYGIDDPRFHFINHPQNLGEIQNMNELLCLARGRYFTWFGEDDLYSPDFLEAVENQLAANGFPSAVLTSYGVVETRKPTSVDKAGPGPVKVMTGREFLRCYLGGNLRTIGPYGVFETALLRRLGGIEPLCDHKFGLYGEYMLLLRLGLLDRVIYLDAPLVTYRHHDQAPGIALADASLYLRAGGQLIQNSAEILSEPSLRQDFRANLSGIFRLTFSHFALKVMLQHGYPSPVEFCRFAGMVVRQIGRLQSRGLEWAGWLAWISAVCTVVARGCGWLMRLLVARLAGRKPPGPPSAL